MHASEFRTRLRDATETSDPQARLDRLTALARYPLSYVENLQLDRALGALSEAGQRSHVEVKAAILSSATIDHLLPAIRVAGLRKQLLIDIHGGAFGQYRQELLSPDSAVARQRPDVVILALTAADFVAGIPLAADRDTVNEALGAAVSDLRSLWGVAKRNAGALVMQQSFLDVAPPLLGSHDRLVPGAPGRLVAQLNSELAAAAAADGVLWLDVAGASARDGIDAWFDPRHWLQGKMEIAPEAADRYGELVARLIGAHYGRSKKCLVLDLDNTLWGGVVGDDGLDGIVLGEGSAAGEAYLALQKYARMLKDRGVILAVCSKNDASVVSEAFERHPEMHLRREDISAFAVNWDDKAENLKAIAKQLNLGLDSLVFVDDNPAERARIRESLPMVGVPELPEDPSYYVRAIADQGYFEAVALTKEDTQRASQYAANIEREALRGQSQSLDDFLRGLEMAVAFGPVTRLELARACQLVNKTNQFNTTTVRLKPEELTALAAAPESLTLQFRLADRFGDNGLVSVMLFRGDAEMPGVLELASWVMSCRVFGRQLEEEAMNVAVEAARDRGVRELVADYVPTPKNAVIKDLYAKLGFTQVGEQADGRSRWRLELSGYCLKPTHISREAHDD